MATPGGVLDAVGCLKPMSLSVGRFGTFHNGVVLFLELADEASVSAVSTVQAAAEALFRSMMPDGVVVSHGGSGSFHAHLSVAKGTHKHSLPLGVPAAIPAQAYADLEDLSVVPGPVRVGDIHLCALQWPTKAQGIANKHNYYNVVASVSLAAAMN